MESRELTVKIYKTQHFVKLFNGFFDLTNKEIDVISAFIDQSISLKDTNINAFSAESKKQVAKILNISDFNALNMYIKKLSSKKAIKKVDDGYVINPILMPLSPDEKNIVIECQNLKMK